jgi:hypothetical protein
MSNVLRYTVYSLQGEKKELLLSNYRLRTLYEVSREIMLYYT